MTRAGVVRLSVAIALVCFTGAVIISAIRGHAGPGLWLTAGAALAATVSGRLALRGPIFRRR